MMIAAAAAPMLSGLPRGKLPLVRQGESRFQITEFADRMTNIHHREAIFWVGKCNGSCNLQS
jgi:hypothetical protein